MNLIVPLRIVLRAPFTVRGNATGNFGVDAPLFRTAGGAIAIPGSLIIGKLAEAFRHIAEAGGAAGQAYRDDLIKILAEGSKRETVGEHEKTDGREARRLISASDFIWKDEALSTNSIRTRIAMDGVTQTVSDGMLQVLEQAAVPGKELVFEGEVRVTGRVADRELESRIIKALEWVLQIGGLRTVGFGEVVSVQQREGTIPVPATPAKSNSTIGLRLSFRDVFCVADKRTHSNTFTSSHLVSGAAIKGAIASQILAFQGASGSLGENALALKEPYASLAHAFDRIRFRHAFPIAKDAASARKGPLPLSLAMAGEKLVDRAGPRFDGRPVLIDNKVPQTIGDWKSDMRSRVEKQYGIDTPGIDFRMRTQVDPEHRAAMEARLFAIENRRNDTHDFVSIIDVPDDVDRGAIINALDCVFSAGLAGIGRGGAYCDVSFCEPQPEDVVASHIMMLKTPALLRVPDPGEFPKLRADYEAAFAAIGLEGSGFRLKAIYADESLAGHAFMQNRRRKPDYLPYLLTSAGSVFIFEHDDPNAKLPASWFRSGLPIPEAVKLFHGFDRQAEPWRFCPYIPENGYGEVVRYSPEPFHGDIEKVDFVDWEAA